jgi:CO/xanthine dehydrogenase Mo-binding subunit
MKTILPRKLNCRSKWIQSTESRNESLITQKHRESTSIKISTNPNKKGSFAQEHALMENNDFQKGNGDNAVSQPGQQADEQLIQLLNDLYDVRTNRRSVRTVAASSQTLSRRSRENASKISLIKV